MRKFLDIQSDAFGLDISELSLKFTKLQRKKKGMALEFYGEADIPRGVIENGAIIKEKEVVKVLHNALAHVPRAQSLRYVAVSLPEEKTFTTVIQTPRIPKEELSSVVSYEAENTIPFSIDEVYLDFQVLPPREKNQDHHDVLLVAAPKIVVDSYLSCIEATGYTPIVFETESTAIARALMSQKKSHEPTLILDVGAMRTNLLVFSGNALSFTFSIPVSSYLFTKSISEKLSISMEEAEELKRKYGLELWNKVTLKGKEKKSPIEQFEMEIEKDKEVMSALEPSLQELVKEVKKHIEHYKTHGMHGKHTGQAVIQKVLLSGGGAGLKGLPSFLSSALEIPVQVANPLINIVRDKGDAELSFTDSLRYTTALGLALGTAQDHE